MQWALNVCTALTTQRYHISLLSHDTFINPLFGFANGDRFC